MKMMNFRARDPEAQARGQRGLDKGNRLERIVWGWYEGREADLERDAGAIRITLESAETCETARQEALDDPWVAEASEGRLLTRVHVARERNRTLVRRKKTAFRKWHGRLFCEACGLDFAREYGVRGDGYMECHHRKPVSELRPGDRTSIRDLRFCAPTVIAWSMPEGPG